MHSALRARHSLAMHFATFASSDVEALDPIIELEQAKREMGGLGEGECVQIVDGRWDGRYRRRQARPLSCKRLYPARVLSEERRRATTDTVRTYNGMAKVWPVWAR